VQEYLRAIPIIFAYSETYILNIEVFWAVTPRRQVNSSAAFISCSKSSSPRGEGEREREREREREKNEYF
jgi:hypothetical protein